ncbi:hypothetical protein NST74_29860 [Paenibacillus sp. FSL F4-0125]|uniref:hypothetical protein n=1 Tax=Paenibacillus sp. FSL F4-0125 TaxID=2954730 RepID=UPI0030F4B5B9
MMPKKKMRVDVYIADSLQAEIKVLADRYEVSAAYVLQTGYKLCDRRLLEKMLSINLIND